jgi:hypothetical protein
MVRGKAPQYAPSDTGLCMPRHPLPAGPRTTARSAARTERVLAVGRAFLTVTGLIAIYLDPTEPARLREVTYSVLLAYAVYSLAVLAYVNGTARLTPVHGQALHGLDIFWTSALTFVSEGPVSPFYLLFLFVGEQRTSTSIIRRSATAPVPCCRRTPNGWTSTRITVEGHCDSRGTAEYNLALGERRASAVKDYLVSLGIAPDRIATVSKGEETPVCLEESEGCWQQNRRGHPIITAK